MLTPEERNDLRKKVLRGESLTVNEAREVYLSLRQGQALSAEEGKEKKARKGGKGGKRKAMDDQALNSSLDAALGSV